MDLKEVMEQKVFVVVGETLREEKYAYKIKHALLEHGYEVFSVGKELLSIDDVESEIDVIDLCINPIKGLELMHQCSKSFKCVVIQPGAESKALLSYLQEKQLPYIESCLLVGLNLYANN